MGEGVKNFDADFAIGVNADAELAQSLSDIISNAKTYSDCMDNLVSYFNQADLWEGEDADTLRQNATAANGPIERLKEYGKELDKLSELASELKGAIGLASSGLSGNIQAALGAGGNGGNA